MSEALVVGESLIDIVERDGGADEYPGGSPMNVAVALGRLGRAVEFATWIGQDVRGAAIERHLAESRVELLPGSTTADRTSTAAVTLNQTGQAE